MLLLSQIREELALYFELIGQPKTAAEKAIRDRIVNLHNELVKIEVVAAVVPVADLQAVVADYETTDKIAPASFSATLKAIEALIEARNKKASESQPSAAVEASTDAPKTE